MAQFKRPIAVILLCSLQLQLAGCTIRTVQRVPLAGLYPDELGGSPETSQRRVAGVTLSDQWVLMFDSVPAVRVARDTVYGNVDGVPHAIPRGRVARVWVAGPVGRAREINSSDFDSALLQTWAQGSGPVGLTTRDGVRVAFDRDAPAYIAGDRLFAWARGAPYAIALADVKRVAVSRVNRPVSLLVTLGVVGVIVVALVSSLPNLSFGFPTK